MSNKTERIRATIGNEKTPRAPLATSGQPGAPGDAEEERLMFRKGMYLAMVLAVTLAASGTALAAGKTSAARVEKDGGFFLRAWQWIESLWADAGPCMDPDGKCTSAPAVPTADNGACIDPNGKCTSSTSLARILGSSDAGPCIDPNGKCTTAPH